MPVAQTFVLRRVLMGGISANSGCLVVRLCPVRTGCLRMPVWERCGGGLGGLVFGTLLGPEATGPGGAGTAVVVLGTHGRPPGSTRRKVGTTSSHHAPYVLGCTRATMAGTMSCDTARWSESQKAGLSSDWGLQLDPMKSESLVIADQHCCGEYVPGPCTHRPSRHESR